MARQNRHDIAFYNPLAGVPTAAARSKIPTFESFGDSSQRRKPKFEASTGLRRPGQRREVQLENEPTPLLYEMARTAAGLGEVRDVQRIVEHLLVERREEPNLRIYSALILSNVHPGEGAAWRVSSLLEEMADEGLTMDVGICHDVLKVLSVHLDYLLRADVLEFMRNRWLVLTDEGHHHVAAALFREGQLELGLEKLEQMKSDGCVVRPWLADLAAYTLADSGEFSAALDVLRDQVAAGDLNISKSVWWYLLDKASAAFHYEATSYCWKSQVNTGYLNPSSGICLNVLTTAARAGDATLATDIFHVLGKRGTIFQAIHYEQLIATYMSTDPVDLRAALTVLVIMATVKLEPTSMSTRPLFTHLSRNRKACLEAFEILVSLNEADRTVPIAALNVIIEANVFARDFEQALTVYKAMHTFERPSASEPHKPLANVETFNFLIRGTYRASSVDAHETALFLAAEMVALGIRPNALTYDRLILVCVWSKRFDHAWRYFDEMVSLGFKPRRSTTPILAKELASIGDGRCWDALQSMQEDGIASAKVTADVEARWAQWKNKGGANDLAQAFEHVPDEPYVGVANA